jgi:hypothetical protein
MSGATLRDRQRVDPVADEEGKPDGIQCKRPTLDVKHIPALASANNTLSGLVEMVV